MIVLNPTETHSLQVDSDWRCVADLMDAAARSVLQRMAVSGATLLEVSTLPPIVQVRPE